MDGFNNQSVISCSIYFFDARRSPYSALQRFWEPHYAGHYLRQRGNQIARKMMGYARWIIEATLRLRRTSRGNRPEVSIDI